MTLVRETGCSRDALNAGVSQRIGFQVGRVFQDQIRVRVEFSDGVLAVHNLHHGLGGRSPPSPRGPLPAIPYSSSPDAWVTRSRHGPQLEAISRAEYFSCSPELHVILSFSISSNYAILTIRNYSFP